MSNMMHCVLCLAVLLGYCRVPYVGAVVTVAAASPASSDAAEDAARMLGIAEISRGICTVLGCEDTTLILELVRQSHLFVHVLAPRETSVAKLRTLADGEKLYGKRLIAEKGSVTRLPYADNMIDVVMAPNPNTDHLSAPALSEILRVLRPHGKYVFRNRPLEGNALTSGQIEQRLRDARTSRYQIHKGQAADWVEILKPEMAGTDDWSHWEHGPDNNPVSRDTAIRAPYMTQWYGEPLYSTMPAITTAAGGRTFLAMGHIAHHEREEPWLNTLYARNGYNSTLLWSRKLPEGYLVHRSAFVATDDIFYLIDTDGSGCLLLDPETGKQQKTIEIPQAAGDWQWIAIENNVLYALVGKEPEPPEIILARDRFAGWSWDNLSRGYYQDRIPWGFGTTILAYDLGQDKLLWTHQEAAVIDSRAMSMGAGKLFFYGPDSHVGCIDTRSGKIVWTNDDLKIRELIEDRQFGFRGTPGFRTSCLCLYTPDALIFEAETQMNVVAVSTKDGRLLWHKRKATNDPNALFVDGSVLVGVGDSGSTLMIDPLTGNVRGNLGFRKHNCARVTATWDSYFCRGFPEGLMRYDRQSGTVRQDGAVRPGCNDGVIGANGMLYLGPWPCDCNMALIGAVALCSAGDFSFEREDPRAERFETGLDLPAPDLRLVVSDKDWPVYRSNNAHNAASNASVPLEAHRVWQYTLETAYVPTAPTTAGGLVFWGGDDCRIRAVDAATGNLRWTYATGGPVLQPPTIWNGIAYAGSGDGWIYALHAGTGRLQWRFRAAPVERRIMVYGSLCSTWPVNSGILLEDGTLYAAAGIIDYDGTWIYALDAVTGAVKWQNGTSGHLEADLRKGVSAQGVLTIAGDKLYLAGGNLVSPASFNKKTGVYTGDAPGNRRTNRGQEIGLFGQHIILGGRLRYSAARNVVNPATFQAIGIAGHGNNSTKLLTKGKIPPAWDNERMVMVDGWFTTPACYAAKQMEEYLTKDAREIELPAPLWTAPAPDIPEQRLNRLNHTGYARPRERDTVSLAIARNAILTVYETTGHMTQQTRWSVSALNPRDGSVLWEQDLTPWGYLGSRQSQVNTLSQPALAGGLCVDRDGRVIVMLENGNVVCFGAR